MFQPDYEPVAARTREISNTSRSRRASLTFASSSLQQIAQLLVGFVVEPIIIRGLGTELYGAWAIIQQLANYLAVGDLRPASALKLTLAITQHDNDFSAKRRQIGSAVMIWFRMLPLLILGGVILVVIVPSLSGVSAQNIGSVRVAMALAVLNVCLAGLLTIPDNVLRGSNLVYKAMGLSVVLVVLAGLLNILVIEGGLGLVGLSGAVVLVGLLTGGVRLRVAQRAINWFGIERPLRNEIHRLFHISLWVFGASITYLLLNSTDLIVAGITVGAREVGMYAATGLALRLGSGFITNLVGSGSAGLADLWGKGAVERVAQVRLLTQLTAIFATTWLGVEIIIFNQAFLRLWTDSGLYAGDWVNLILVLIAVVSISSRADILIMDFMLVLKKKTFISLIAGIISTLLSLLLAFRLGLVGIALGTLAGQLMVSVYVAHTVSNRLRLSLWQYARSILRLVLSCLVLYGVAMLVAPSVGQANSWVVLIGKGVVVAAVSLPLLWLGGLTLSQRNEIVQFGRNALLPKLIGRK